jgi:GNAT superfamily N-acetyltransferase
MITTKNNIEIIDFSNQTKQDKKHLKQFVDFHWTHYANDPQYVPLLDYEYLGFKLLGIHGFFEPDNIFFKHADMRFFLALRDGQVVGRCNAFVNFNHNKQWNDKVGFFGQFETIDDQKVTYKLLEVATEWLKAQGMDTIRGPQNLPVNEATPGVMTAGFGTRPVMYYHYNKPYYCKHLEKAGFNSVKQVFSWEVSIMNPMEEKLVKISEKVIDRYGIKIELWKERPLDVRKKEMLEIYNDAWNDNFGFVPFTSEEFNTIINDMQLIMDKNLFIFLYINDEPAAFIGGVPNVTEKLTRIRNCRNCELLRAIRMLLGKSRTTGIRLGYLGVKKKFRKLGLAGILMWKQKQYCQQKGYQYCDMGWVLDDNIMVIRIIEMMSAVPSKTFTIYEKSLKSG